MATFPYGPNTSCITATSTPETILALLGGASSIPVPRGIAIHALDDVYIGPRSDVTADTAVTAGFLVKADTNFEIPPGMFANPAKPDLTGMWIVTATTATVYLMYPGL
jgi:hypothetical protein